MQLYVWSRQSSVADGVVGRARALCTASAISMLQIIAAALLGPSCQWVTSPGAGVVSPSSSPSARPCADVSSSEPIACISASDIVVPSAIVCSSLDAGRSGAGATSGCAAHAARSSGAASVAARRLVLRRMGVSLISACTGGSRPSAGRIARQEKFRGSPIRPGTGDEAHTGVVHIGRARPIDRRGRLTRQKGTP